MLCGFLTGRYLLALKALALDVGMAPVAFTKTGWPTRAGQCCPAALPLLPYYGGYPDAFFKNAFVHDAPTPDPGGWLFGDDKMAQRARLPTLGVEDGGGMASDYTHRVNMFSKDMPSFHAIMVANGVAGLGYYMYHGGNNPAPLGSGSVDPARTLQESSFQPLGARNGMPSASYDFFAPPVKLFCRAAEL